MDVYRFKNGCVVYKYTYPSFMITVTWNKSSTAALLDVIRFLFSLKYYDQHSVFWCTAWTYFPLNFP